MGRPTTPKTQFLLGQHKPKLRTETTVRLHPRRGREPSTRASKLGGRVAWPAEEPWPTCEEHGDPCVAVLQLRRVDVPELEFPKGTDLFQLLWCPKDHEDPPFAPWPVVRWRSGALVGQLLAPPAPVKGATEQYVPRDCVLNPERVLEYPSAYDIGLAQLEELDDLIREKARKDLKKLGIPDDDPLYQYHFSVAPGTKVGGYVAWIQDAEVPMCECGKPMTHLLTVASAEFDGAYQRWMPLSERSVWKGSLEARLKVQEAAGLMFGDMGNYYLFTCRACPARPVKAVMQCS